MTDVKARFHQRLLGRTLLFVVLPTTLVLAAVLTLAVQRGFQNLRRASELTLQLESKLAAQDLEALNRNAVVSAERMAEAQMAGMFGDRTVSLEYARRVLDGTTEFTGAYFGYEPDADGRDAESLGKLPAAAMDPTGRFIPYWFIDPETREIKLEPLVDMETSLYYQGAREALAATGTSAPLITEPYVYRGKMIVEQVHAIVIDDAFAGVAGVDRALTDVEAYLRGLAERVGADAFLLSSRGKFIAATTDPPDALPGRGSGDQLLKTKNIADTPYRELLGSIVGETSETSLRRADDPTDQEPYYFAAGHIPTGGWTVVLRRPERAVVAPIIAQLRYGVGLAVLGVIFVVTVLVHNLVRVSRRVNVAVSAAEQVARGDLSECVEPGDSPDETGTLLRSLATMTTNLNTLIGGVKQASIQINSTATQLAATSRQQESVAAGFGSSANEIAAAVKQISATGGELVNTMSEVSRVATDTASRATAGRSGLEEMGSTMRSLEDATTSIADKLAVINDKTSRITGVVTTITKVAEQTNLLSVNAAIEAEKAGEYGVGFLVVAREIRRLADQTGAATYDIERMVEQMESAVSAGVMEMDRFADQVRRGVKEVTDVSGQLERIIQQVDANTESFEQVSEGMRSQSQGADQISEAMAQLTDGAAHTMSSIREYAHAADDLQNAIAALKTSIASFRLEGN